MDRDNRTYRTRSRVGVVAGLMVAMLIALLVALNWPSSPTSPKFIVNGQNLGRDISFETGFAPIVQAVLPAVVNVSSTRIRQVDESAPFFNDPFFRRFFGDRDPVPERREQALGSGVIVTREGHILTNNHVVEGASQVLVFLNERDEYSATIVGTDPQTDLAVLKVDGAELNPVALGQSAGVQIGQFVLAIGNPFGVGRTVTMGIVSATGRGNLGIVGYEDFIQTDAAINPGNSGGALVDQDGRLVGINTAILTGTRGNLGIGFAVPIDMARSVMEQIVEQGRVVRGYLGVGIQELTPAMARAMNLEESRGALVNDVTQGGPAQRAGLQRGDVIVSVNGEPVADSRALRFTIASLRPGTAVRLQITRDGQSREVSVTLGELPTQARAEDPIPSPQQGSATVLGIQIQELTPQIRQQLELPPATTGVLVVRVQPGTRAAEAGLLRGDVIREVNRRQVRNTAEFRQAMDAAPGDQPVLFLVNRGGGTFYVAIER
jgi:serine protease Do